jgi:hypothetical protein
MWKPREPSSSVNLNCFDFTSGNRVILLIIYRDCDLRMSVLQILKYLLCTSVEFQGVLLFASEKSQKIIVEIRSGVIDHEHISEGYYFDIHPKVLRKPQHISDALADIRIGYFKRTSVYRLYTKYFRKVCMQKFQHSCFSSYVKFIIVTMKLMCVYPLGSSGFNTFLDQIIFSLVFQCFYFQRESLTRAVY